LHASNFIVNLNKEQLYTIDLDSCKIGTNLTFSARYLTSSALLNNVKGKYNVVDTDLSYVEADENTDIYFYIITILNYLYGSNINNISIDAFYHYLNYLEHIGFNHELIDYFSRIVNNKKNENPINLLDTITEEQVYRAREIVYRKVSKKYCYS